MFRAAFVMVEFVGPGWRDFATLVSASVPPVPISVPCVAIPTAVRESICKGLLTRAERVERSVESDALKLMGERHD